MATTLVWHLWPGRHWPATQTEEVQFVAELTDRAPAATGHERMDTTAVLNALRCGITTAALSRFAPGIDPAALLAAYRDLEDRRAQAAAAWTAIISNPTLATITEHAPTAAQMLPVPVDRIAKAATIVSAASLARVVALVHTEVCQAHDRAQAVEQSLTGRTEPDEQAVALGAVLHNPHEPGLWGHPYFLAPRVGALSPLRVADLLGERPR